MKKLLFTMLALLLMAGGAFAQNDSDDDDSDSGSSQTSFPDVPEGSYAADAVAELADLGIVIGFPDGTFRGNEAFTRYQAALVVTRLIDVLESQFVTEDELASLRNAVQEIASDIAALEAAISSGMGMDPEAMQDLQNQLEELRTALDTLQALEARVSQNTRSIDALNDLVALLNEEIVGLQAGGDIDPSFLEDIQRNTDDIANIREFVILLRRDQVALRDQLAVLEESDAQQNERISGLEERVSTLEDQAITFNGSIGVEYEVGRLSGDANVCPVPLVDTDLSDTGENFQCGTFGDDGTFTPIDTVITPFDVDRIFGIGFEREVPASVFSTGTDDYDDDDSEDDDGEVAQDREDIENEKGDVEPTFEISFGFSSERGVAGAFNDFEATVTLELVEVTVLDADEVNSDDDLTNDELTDSDNYLSDAYVFSFSELETTFTPIGAEPLTFTFGEDPDAEFTPYVFESLGAGFVARLGTPDVLAFLQPELVIAYGVYQEEGNDKPEDDAVELPDDNGDLVVDGGENPFADAYYRALRGTLSPLEGISGGFSVAQLTGNADEEGDATGDNQTITVYGLDGEANISILTVRGEFAANSVNADINFPVDDVEDATYEVPAPTPDDPEATNDVDCIVDNVIAEECIVDVPESETLFFVEAEVDVEDVPIVDSFSANYRSIPQFWVGLREDDDGYPYDLDQTGFGANAGLGFFIFNLDAYVDSYSTTDDGNVLTYGAELGVEVFRAIEPFAFYNEARIDGDLVSDLGDAERDTARDTGFGVGLRHDGSADNALVPGLTFSVGYNLATNDVSTEGLAASANADLTFGFLTVNPYVNYETENNPVDSDDDDLATLEAGTGLETEPLDFFLAPSLVANVNYRNTAHTETNPDEDANELEGNYDATELQFSAGLSLNEFLFENSVLSVRYGYYQGTNISTDIDPNNSDDDPDDGDDLATNISEGDFNNGVTQTTQGYEVAWTYYGLEFGYGRYNLNRTANSALGTDATSVNGQAFSVAYEVTF